MKTTEHNVGIEVLLQEQGTAEGAIRIELATGQGQGVTLTPEQARLLANQIIQSAYRADVRSRSGDGPLLGRRG